MKQNTSFEDGRMVLQVPHRRESHSRRIISRRDPQNEGAYSPRKFFRRLDCFPRQFLKSLTKQVKSQLVFVRWKYTVTVQMLRNDAKNGLKRGKFVKLKSISLFIHFVGKVTHLKYSNYVFLKLLY